MIRPITLFVKNPEAHALALAADGFRETKLRKRLSSWPTRCFQKIHNGGLLIETQHIDMSRAPLDALDGSHQATVEVDLKLNLKALRQLTNDVKNMTAFLSEHHGLIERLNRYAPFLKNDPLISKEIDDFLDKTRRIYKNLAP